MRSRFTSLTVSRIAAGVLAGICMAVTVLAIAGATYPPHGIDTSYPPNDLYTVRDTVCCRNGWTDTTFGAAGIPQADTTASGDTTATGWGDTLVPDGSHVLYGVLTVDANPSAYGVVIYVSPAETQLDSTGFATRGPIFVAQGTSQLIDCSFDSGFVYGVWATAAPGSSVHYQLVVPQMKQR